MPERCLLLGTVVSVPRLPRLDAPPAGKSRKFRSLVTCPQGPPAFLLGVQEP